MNKKHEPRRGTPRENAARLMQLIAFAAALLVVNSVLSTAAAALCGSPAPGKPMLITDDCVEPRFNQPYIDIDQSRTDPVPHRYVHGGFTGTDAKFSFYLPPPDQYQGRFIQGPTHQLTFSENLDNTQVAFVIASGGYAVQTNMGGSEAARSTEGVLFFGQDPSVVGYRVNAAAAKYSRVVAGQMYGSHRPYGYIHGGSGGAFQTVSALENTTVYDGGVPFVLGSPNHIPNVYTVRVHAQRILAGAGKFPCILDAFDPGGSGNPKASCNLTREQSRALDEATRLGFPPRAWFGSSLTGAGALPLVAGYVPYLDQTYTEDFWTKPGYLGYDALVGEQPNSILAARIVHSTIVTEKLIGPTRLRLQTFPSGDLTAIDLRITSGAGATLNQLGLLPGYIRGPSINAAQSTVTLPAAAAAIFNAVQVGDAVALDNSHYLALQTYHRHQVGGPEWDFYPWDQFRDRSGNPIYPQREVLTGPVGQFNGAGGPMTGDFHGKMIVQESLMDPDAFPWAADWYKRKVEEVLGRQQLNDKFRVYFQDHAQHGGVVPSPSGTTPRTVSYTGALQQDLRHLAAWVEQGVRPPPSTSYKIVNYGQVEVPWTAERRKGIQPVVDLTVSAKRSHGGRKHHDDSCNDDDRNWPNGKEGDGRERRDDSDDDRKGHHDRDDEDGERVDVAIGEVVTLCGRIEVPPRAGKVVSAEWNFDGTGFVPAAIDKIRPAVNVRAVHSFSQPGTYFVVLRGTSHNEGDPNTPFARVENIDRVRVVVR
jgi:hypothetical protein